jgi:uncharacterized membrane protein SpoIIM required for sporulation
MDEVAFLQKNADKWEQFERLLRDDEADADRLADLYVEITDDLAYAQTFYPDGDTTRYLNDLAGRAHRQVYQTRSETARRLLTFWTEEVPAALAAARTELGLSLGVFLMAVGVGTLSAAYDPGFVRLILGDAYVNETLASIEAGDPMAVYKEMHQVPMFLGIALNNIRVAFYAFAAGVLCSVGTAVVLVQNGIMLGAFHYLFYEYGLLGRSLLVVYVHGTLEIAAIVVAGAAGFVLGNGLLFPGSYPRLTSLRRSAKQGLKIVVGLVPVFAAAAFLEGFVTRYTQMPAALSLTIIGASLALVLGYFGVYPALLRSDASRFFPFP